MRAARILHLLVPPFLSSCLGAETEHAKAPDESLPSEPGAVVFGVDPDPTQRGKVEDEAGFEEPVLIELPVDGLEPAIVSLPRGPVRREPLLVAAHGAGGGPTWQCETWRHIIEDRGVILCPAGKRFGGGYDGYFFPDHHQLERIVFAAVEAAEKALSDYIDPGPAVYAAYSQGATMGALMIVAHAERFPRLILVEGGFSEWNVARGTDFKEMGGDRVLFACGTRHCGTKAERSAKWLERAGVRARVVTEPSAGHTYGGAVARELKRLFDWVVERDPRWRGAAGSGRTSAGRDSKAHRGGD